MDSILLPRWRQRYQEAILEADRSLLRQRIVMAESAINRRISELDADAGSDYRELDALAKARGTLRCLRRLANEGKAA